MSMTVDSQAQSLFNQYTLENSQSGQNPVDPSTVSEGDFGVSNLTNALSVLNSSSNPNPYTPNLDQYANSVYEISQLPEYTALSGMVGNLTNALNIPGSVDNSVAISSMQSKLGLDSGTFNIYGVSSASSTAQQESLESSASQNFPTLSDASYNNFLSQNIPGSNLNTEA